MPLRRWFATRGLPGWYSWVVVTGFSLITSGLSLFISIHVIHQAQQTQHQQQEQGRIASCVVVVAQDNAFAESTPATRAGLAAARAWHSLREQLRCDHE